MMITARACKEFRNDMLGCNSVSWAPSNSVGGTLEDGTVVKRLVTGKLFLRNACNECGNCITVKEWHPRFVNFVLILASIYCLSNVQAHVIMVLAYGGIQNRRVGKRSLWKDQGIQVCFLMSYIMTLIGHQHNSQISIKYYIKYYVMILIDVMLICVYSSKSISSIYE